jgi:hypothetical protein
VTIADADFVADVERVGHEFPCPAPQVVGPRAKIPCRGVDGGLAETAIQGNDTALLASLEIS